jgi:hypothetical protein
MTELTTEWLEQAIAAMESDRDDMPFGLSDWQNNTLAALKIALSSIAREPASLVSELPPIITVNDITTGKRITITLPDTNSKAFWSGTGKSEIFHPDAYKRWVKAAIERDCIIAGIEARVK